MSVRSAQSITKTFNTYNPTTGALANADSTPSGTLIVNGTDNAASVTVTNRSTGDYKFAVTLPTLAVGDIVEMKIAATVSSTSSASVVWSDTKDIVIDSSGNVTFANTSIATVTTLTNDPAGVTTLLARLGAFTGSGLNTVLGFLRAMMRKTAALTPSDLGGTFDNTTDSQEATTDAIAGIDTGGASAEDIAEALAQTRPINVYAPASGQTLDLYRGDTYSTAEGTAITITKIGTESHWPTTLTTVHFTAHPTDDTLSEYSDAVSLDDVACTVVDATGSDQEFALELDGDDMADLTPASKGYTFWFIANKDTAPKVLRSGLMIIRPSPVAP